MWTTFGRRYHLTEREIRICGCREIDGAAMPKRAASSIDRFLIDLRRVVQIAPFARELFDLRAFASSSISRGVHCR
jgi:hypothetical protein